ncbi:purine-cytosine permease FCY21 [Hortaea werneckii]|nr:purine-cytosine permease FCY21 [Hortaea werneckii]KAI7105420.1 purine-cytosine permease FCY21 [Hortaea werneckii]KAI7236593.1 purine-cytosine permease FCY21 [Hortaea werneckii]KAI7338729.1 purine-cytosine permease FCY21 [Hortaea werneckii]
MTESSGLAVEIDQEQNNGLDRLQNPDHHDVEKGRASLAPKSAANENASAADAQTSSSWWRRRWRSVERTLVRYNLEARGIQRVLPDERHDMRQLGYIQIAILWFSVNLTANNLTLGMLGPAVYYLPFLDSCLCAVFGAIVGSLPVAYIATFGPRSGNRTMVFARYSMGFYPSKIIVILNLIVLLGYSLIDTVVAGQILSAVSPNGSMSVIVGIIITAVIAWCITTFGYGVFHYYERYAWLPQLIVICILAGAAGPQFDLYGNPSAGETTETIVGNRLSFFSLCLAAAITYSGGAADYFVYYPEETPKHKVLFVTLAGLVCSFSPMFILGIGLGSGMATNSTWSDAYGVSQGALAVQGFAPLGPFGSFLSVVLALGLIANLIAPTYSSGVDFQVLGRYLEKVPRVVWNTIGVIIYTVCAVAGRQNLANIFTNFLALMGYWVSIWIAIVLEEHLIFRKWLGIGWNWDAWNDKRKLPLGAAALVAFVIGWIGSILCMAQVWYIGPLAALVGQYGADMGNYVGFGWAGLTYLPLRWLELRRLGR